MYDSNAFTAGIIAFCAATPAKCAATALLVAAKTAEKTASYRARNPSCNNGINFV